MKDDTVLIIGLIAVGVFVLLPRLQSNARPGPVPFVPPTVAQGNDWFHDTTASTVGGGIGAGVGAIFGSPQAGAAIGTTIGPAVEKIGGAIGDFFGKIF